MPKWDATLQYPNWRRNQVLRFIRTQKDASKTSIQRATHMGMESVLSMVNDLLEKHLIENAGVIDTPVGRKASLLRINPDGCYFIGVKFNARSIVGIVSDFEFNIVHQMQIILPESVSAEALNNNVCVCIDALLRQAGAKASKIISIGVGCPGYVNSEKGTIVRYVHIPGYENIPIKKIIEDRYHLPVYIENSLRCTLLSLKLLPCNQHFKDMALVQIGRGIGMASICNGKLYHGANNVAGSIGHISVTDENIRCECGKNGCLEACASILTMAEKTKKLISDHVIPEPEVPSDLIGYLCILADNGDPSAQKLIRENTGYLAKVMTQIVAISNPEVIIFDSKLTESRLFCSEMNRLIDEKCSTEGKSKLSIRYTRMDSTSDALGAAQWAYWCEFESSMDQ